MKLEDFGPFKLSVGKHKGPEEGMCVMEMVSFLAGDEWSDMPQCACPILSGFCQRINDRFGQEQRDELQTLVPMLIGTRSPEHEKARADILAWGAVRKFAPFYFRKAGLIEWADRLAGFQGSLRDAQELLFEARKAADALAAAYAYAAAGAAAYAAAEAAEAAAAAYAAYAAAADAAAAVDAAAAASAYAAADAAAAYAYAAADAAAAAAADAAADAADAAAAEVFPVVMEVLREAIAAGPRGEAYSEIHMRRGADLRQLLSA